MNLENIETRFSSYLDRYWKLSDIAPFILTYIQLLLLFKNELTRVELNVISERKKQLRGEQFTDECFDELRNSSRQQLDSEGRVDTVTTKKVMLNWLLFCALLDTAENDIFYLIEPIFEFAKKMEISPDQLKQILESEFIEFKI